MKTLLISVLLTCALFSSQKYYVEPFHFPELNGDTKNTPLKVALQTVFLNAGVQYSIEVKDIESYGVVVLTTTEKQELDTVLTLILEPKGLEFSVDASGIYHIAKKAKDYSGQPRITRTYALTYSCGSGTPDEVTSHSKSEEKEKKLLAVDFPNAPIKESLEQHK